MEIGNGFEKLACSCDLAPSRVVNRLELGLPTIQRAKSSRKAIFPRLKYAPVRVETSISNGNFLRYA